MENPPNLIKIRKDYAISKTGDETQITGKIEVAMRRVMAFEE
jgi:hypothetical protein